MSRCTCRSRPARSRRLGYALDRARQGGRAHLPPKFVKKVMSFGHKSQAFENCVAAVSKSFALYAAAPAAFASRASFFALASSSSTSSISTSSCGGSAAGFGGGDWGLGGGDDGDASACARMSSGTLSPEKPCMSTPMSAPSTWIMRGSEPSRLDARPGFVCIICSFATNAGSSSSFAVFGFVFSLPIRFGSENILSKPVGSSLRWWASERDG